MYFFPVGLKRISEISAWGSNFYLAKAVAWRLLIGCIRMYAPGHHVMSLFCYSDIIM